MLIRELKFLIVLALAISTGIAAQAYPTHEKEICNLGWEHYKHQHREAEYQHAWCSMNDGIEEYENADYTRVDCLTPTHAVEFDFWHKWAESIGQALHYGYMTGKKPKVVLILENPKRQMCYYYRVKKLSEKYKFDVEYITPEILNMRKNKVTGNNNNNN